MDFLDGEKPLVSALLGDPSLLHSTTPTIPQDGKPRKILSGNTPRVFYVTKAYSPRGNKTFIRPYPFWGKDISPV